MVRRSKPYPLPLGLMLTLALVTGGSHFAQAAISGPLAKTVAKGEDVFLHDTFGGRGMTCDACHRGAGRGPTQLPGSSIKGPSLSNAAAVFPRFKPREGKVITLEDEIQGCIKGALGGKAPAYDSATMRALTAYVISLSQGKTLDMGGAYQ